MEESCDITHTDCSGLTDYFCCVIGGMDSCRNNHLLLDYVSEFADCVARGLTQGTLNCKLSRTYWVCVDGSVIAAACPPWDRLLRECLQYFTLNHCCYAAQLP